MNDEYSKNGTLTGPLIFTVPAYGFVMALYLDWLGQSSSIALPVRAATAKSENESPARGQRQSIDTVQKKSTY